LTWAVSGVGLRFGRNAAAAGLLSGLWCWAAVAHPVSLSSLFFFSLILFSGFYFIV
jgi:hypothetical protein